MTFKEKTDRFSKEICQRGLPRRRFIPIFFPLLWRIGINIPPPVFWGYWQASVYGGTLILSVVIFSSVIFSYRVTGVLSVVTVVIFMDLIYGFLLAKNFRKQRERYSWGSWEQYPKIDVPLSSKARFDS